MPKLQVSITNKIATYVKRCGSIVCGNSDYEIEFAFDQEWDDHPQKTARFIWGGQYYDVDFEGTTCPVPIVTGATLLSVGVYSGNLCTTTPALIGCERSILCGGEPQNEGSAEQYTNEAKAAADRAEAAAEAAAEEAVQHFAEASAEQALGGIVQTTGDSETQVMSQKAATEEFLKIVDVDYPQNYANFTNANVAYNPASVSVTTDETSITLEHARGINDVVCLAVDGLTEGEEYLFSFTNNTLYGAPFIVRYAKEGSPGQEYARFTTDGDGVSTCVFVAPAEKIYIRLAIAYNVDVASATDISITEAGAVESRNIKTELLRDIEEDNLSEELRAKLDKIPSDNPCDYAGEDICVFTKGICIGDSMTAGTFNHLLNGTTSNYVVDAKYSYPAVLQKLTGIELANMGIGGITSSGWYTANQGADLSGYDFAIVQLGINDVYSYDGWTDTSVQAFTSIINKLKTENKNIKIFVATIIPATSYRGDKFDAVSQGIRDFVAGLGDENVILLDLAVYGHTGDEVAYNCGHLSAYGYWRLAKDYKAYIGWYMNKNPDVFREIQFIGTDYVYEEATQ